MPGIVEADAGVVFTVRSLSDMRERFTEGHPLFRAGTDGDPGAWAWEEFFGGEGDSDSDSDAPGFREVMEEEFQLTYDELFALFPGEAGLALHNPGERAAGEDERPEFVFMAEYAGEPERLHELMRIQFERNAEAQKEKNPEIEHELVKESFMGETLYLDETYDGERTYYEDGYALVDGFFVLATPETRLRSVTEAIKEGAENPLRESEAYLRLREEGERPAAIGIYLNLETLLAPVVEALEGGDVDDALAMFGVTGKSLREALGLDALRSYSVEVDWTESGALISGSLLYDGKRGLLRLLSFADRPVPDAPYVPRDVTSTTVSTFDYGALLKNLEAMFTTASPNLSFLIENQLQTIRNQTDVDLRSAIFENLGSEGVTLSRLDRDGVSENELAHEEQVMVFEVLDVEAFSRAVEGLKDLAPGLRESMEERKLGGRTVYSFRAPAQQAGGGGSEVFSYTFTRSHMVLGFGGMDLLREVLGRMDNGDGGFWDSEETRRLLEKIERPDPVSRTYADLGEMVRALTDSFQAIQRTAEQAGAGPAMEIPEVRVPFHLLMESNEAADGIFFRGVIEETEGN